MKFSFFPLVSLSIVMTSGVTFAQRVISPQIEQLRQDQNTQVPSLPEDESQNLSQMPTFASQSPGDEDLGQQVILKTKNEYQPWTTYLGTDATYTSNVGLSDGNEQGDWIWRSTMGAVYAPRFGNNLLGNISLSQDIYRYNKFDALNFESFNIGAGLAYNLWFLYGINASLEFNYSRLTSDGFGDEIFSNRTLSLALSRNFILSRAHYFYVVAGAEAGWSDPEQAARDEFTFQGGYHVRLARDFEMDAFYRLGFYHYTDLSREDVNQIVQVSARYNFTKWLSATATVSTSFNNSNRTGFDYESVNLGVGAFISLKF